jgi:hypothetical protein
MRVMLLLDRADALERVVSLRNLRRHSRVVHAWCECAVASVAPQRRPEHRGSRSAYERLERSVKPNAIFSRNEMYGLTQHRCRIIPITVSFHGAIAVGRSLR